MIRKKITTKKQINKFSVHTSDETVTVQNQQQQQKKKKQTTLYTLCQSIGLFLLGKNALSDWFKHKPAIQPCRAIDHQARDIASWLPRAVAGVIGGDTVTTGRGRGQCNSRHVHYNIEAAINSICNPNSSRKIKRIFCFKLVFQAYNNIHINV